MDTEWEDANRLRQVLGHGEIMTGYSPAQMAQKRANGDSMNRKKTLYYSAISFDAILLACTSFSDGRICYV